MLQNREMEQKDRMNFSTAPLGEVETIFVPTASSAQIDGHRIGITALALMISQDYRKERPGRRARLARKLRKQRIFHADGSNDEAHISHSS